MTEDSKMTRASALRSSVATGTLLRIAAFTAAAAVGATTQADAALYYYPDSEQGYYSQQRPAQPPQRQQHTRRSSAKKKEVAVKDTTVHPTMPLIINISIAKQRVRVYDAKGLFAEAPVSTGMAGHPTPMGVFSVIEKDRYHHSNIYSGAPMPFMQRITWGGVAMHAGVLPGYPASHGCIRMPESFAIKMWGWTKMGARVIVTPGELSPENFSHALLPAMKVAPPPPVAELPEIPLGLKTDKGAPEPAAIPASLELRSSVGHGDDLKPAAESAALRDQTRTADARGKAGTSASTMSDASSGNAARGADARSDTPKAEAAPSAAATDTVGKDSAKDAAAADTSAAARLEADQTAKPAEVAEAAKPGEAASTDKSAEVKAEEKPAEANIDTAKPDAAKTDASKTDASKADATKADAAKPADKLTQPAKTASDAAAPAADAKKDQTRLSGDKPVARRKEGLIAVFISRKDSKLYVRQNFAPLFEVPVTIAASDRPLGTHVFTAEVDKNDSNTLRWTVITVPQSARAAMRDSDEPRSSRRRKGKSAPVVEIKHGPVPDSPVEALDRISIPADVMARILDGMTTGASIVVSDQSIKQGETGEYTDFIIRTY
jgi:lipoprotein-anchoring transpeptidase ErfK/SrfK